MRKLSLLFSLVLGFAAIGCAATHAKLKKKAPKPILIAETIETIPEGLLLRDKAGSTWLLSISREGRLVIRKVPNL